ncbi:MAG: DUF3164 family protein [Candidatus Cloacimonetes bacterium]|nr:DUF3164 family protein [Candidatus Cloacimonadota bacterium]
MSKRTKTLMDAEGREIPEKLLRPDVVQRDRVVRKLSKRAARLNAMIAKEKAKICEELADYLADMAAEVGETWKGNATLQSFDARLKVEFRRRDQIAFGPELQLAEQKFNAFIERRAEGSDEAICVLVKDSFNANNKGAIPIGRIMRLRKFKFDDPDWEAAMALIDKAIDVVSTKDYISFYEKADDGKYVQTVLNFSAI